MAGAELPIEHFMDAGAWERWLEQHPESTGVWLKIAKKDSGVASLFFALNAWMNVVTLGSVSVVE